MKVIGITGGIGSGKSLVCSIIEKIGFPVFYSDIEARKLVVSKNHRKTISVNWTYFI
jgi:dephospho-CoA kinase